MESTVERTKDRVTIRFERHLAHPVEKVWRAVTERDRLNQWFPNDVGVDTITEGATLHYTFRDNEGPAGDGTVIEFDPPRLLVLDWYDAILRIELTAEGDGTRFVFSHTIEDDGERPVRDSAGWHVCIEHLAATLDGGPPVPDDRWKELEPVYAEKLGQH